VNARTRERVILGVSCLVVHGRESTEVPKDRTHEADDARNLAPIRDAQLREQLEQLVLRRSKLDDGEAALLRAVFPEILKAHHDLVWNQLRRRGLDAELEDLVQETFTVLYKHIVDEGFPDHLPGLLVAMADGLFLNHVRNVHRSPESVGLPSSGSEKPTSQPEVERVLDLRALSQRLLPQLSPEHRPVVDVVILGGLSHKEAAAALGIPEGTLKSRVIAAKHALVALAEQFLPPSQRETA
jgi:RNA polymerase sigma-70 factor, ECF subfamily